MAFRNADAYGYTITLPFPQGRSYTIQSPPVEVGHYLIETTQSAAQVQRLLSEIDDLPPGDPRLVEIQDELVALQDSLTIPDDQQDDYLASLLGADVYAAMRNAKEPWELVKLAAATVSVWVIANRDAAEEYWNNGGRRRPTKASSRSRTTQKRGKRRKGTSR